MRKFAAHYVLTETGDLLKNGLAEVPTNGQISLIDTKGSLIEIERLIFHSGILIKGFEYVRNPSLSANLPGETDHPLSLLGKAMQSAHLSLSEVIDLGKQLQIVYPGKTVPELLYLIDQALQDKDVFAKTPLSGLYLLASLDLSTLRFKPSSRLKKII